MQPAHRIHDLLAEHQRLNEMRIRQVSHDQGFQQVVTPPVELPEIGIPTLAEGVYEPWTPMLRARFAYASSWRNADAGVDWLSLQQMEQAATEANLIDLVNARIECWDGSPIRGVPFSRLSLFGLDLDQGEEVYLLWPAVSGEEPAIISYSGNFESTFADFGAYLQHLISGE